MKILICFLLSLLVCCLSQSPQSAPQPPPGPSSGPDPVSGPQPASGPEPATGPEPASGPEPAFGPEPSSVPQPTSDSKPNPPVVVPVDTNAPYTIALKGVNPIAMCVVYKAERWVTFFAVSSDQDAEIPISYPKNWASQIDANGKWRNSTNSSEIGFPEQPEQFHKGFTVMAFKLSTPFFTAPVGVLGQNFKLQTVRWQLNTAFVEMTNQGQSSKYNCPSVASFTVTLSNVADANAAVEAFTATSAELFKGVNVTDTKRLKISHVASGANTVFTFTISPSGYKVPSNLTDIWSSYRPKDVWPPEVEPPHHWELVYLLTRYQDFQKDAESVGSELVAGPILLKFDKDSFKLPANAQFPNGTKASNPDGTPYDPNWVDPNDNGTGDGASGAIPLAVGLFNVILFFVFFLF